MGEIVLDFTGFVNEHKRFDETLTWSNEYKDLFTDFPFEHGVIELVDALDRKWIELKNKYNWNRELRNFRKDHFAMDVKVYIWPDEKKTKEALNYPDLSEEGMYRWWYSFLNDQREAFIDEIDFGWVKDIGFGGKSGGWLVIAPNVTDTDQAEFCEEAMSLYRDTKKLAMEEDQYSVIVKYANDENYDELVKTGMITEPEGISELRNDAENMIKSFTESLEELNQIDSNIQSILAKVEEFKRTGLKLFYEYLQDESSYLSEGR